MEINVKKFRTIILINIKCVEIFTRSNVKFNIYLHIPVDHPYFSCICLMEKLKLSHRYKQKYVNIETFLPFFAKVLKMLDIFIFKLI